MLSSNCLTASGALLKSNWGANQIDAAAANLLEIKRQISEDPKESPPRCSAYYAAWQTLPISGRMGCLWFQLRP